jgi:CRP-like cAMP-binding protein
MLTMKTDLISAALRDYVLNFGSLTNEQTDFVESKGTRSTLSEGKYFSVAGRVPNQVAFLIEGIFRLSYYNDKGEEITDYFLNGNQFIVDYQNFEGRSPSSTNLQAVTDCELLVFSRANWEDISRSIPGWDRIADKIYRKCLIETIEKRSRLVSEDATTRYLLFLEKFPAVANRVPLGYIASFLGITQQSFSRIRRSIR